MKKRVYILTGQKNQDADEDWRFDEGLQSLLPLRC